jgi:hypothetical protein
VRIFGNVHFGQQSCQALQKELLAEIRYIYCKFAILMKLCAKKEIGTGIKLMAYGLHSLIR